MMAIENNKNIEDALSIFRESTKSVLLELSSSEEVIDTIKIEQEAIAKTKEFGIIYALPSLTSFLYYDPSSDLEQLEVPVLGLFGGLDFQVTINQNKDRMENALLKSGADYHFVTFENANHFYQEAKTGRREEYSTLEKKFVDDFLDKISNWIMGN
jgi:pimeloyl-ACP methyl ester carboxylesterase